jgi:transcriptional regulator with XRE-family HTH domain
LTLEEAAERIELLGAQRAEADPEARPVSMTHATLSRVERGKIPYNQTLLEILAEIYGTEPASLIMRDPAADEPIWSLWDALSPPARQQAFAVIEALRKTGTDG